MTATSAQYAFGSGVLYGRVVGGSSPTPIRFGALQDCSVNVAMTSKALFGQYQFPLAIGRGTAKITGKAKFAQLNAQAFNDLFFSESSVGAGEVVTAVQEPNTVTPVYDTIFDAAAKSTHIALSGGNLTETPDGTADYLSVTCDTYKSSGQWYAEGVFALASVNSRGFGVCTSTDSIADGTFFSGANAYGYDGLIGTKRHAGVGIAYGIPYANGDVISILLDMDAGTLTFWVNGVSQGEAYSGLAGSFKLVVSGFLVMGATINTGASAFTYAPPAGYMGWFDSVGATVTHAADYTQDLGTLVEATQQVLQRTANASAASGEYVCNESSGVYLFNADLYGYAVQISYNYQDSANGSNIEITNKFLGSTPIFLLVLTEEFSDNKLTLQLNLCSSSKLTLDSKLEDFWVQDFDFEAFADSTNTIGKLSLEAL